MIKLYPSKEAVEAKLDSLFSEPWRGYEAHNLTGFIGNYCHGNQPGHSIPYTYYFIDKQEKAQCILDSLMNHYYDMGADKLAYAGMDDAGEMSRGMCSMLLDFTLIRLPILNILLLFPCSIK